MEILKERDGDNLEFPKMRMSGESLKEEDGDNLEVMVNFQEFRFSDFLKERDGDNLGFRDFEFLGDSLNEVLPFLLGDGNISGFQDFQKWGFPLMKSSLSFR